MIPLSDCAGRVLSRLARASGSAALTALDGNGLLGERAADGRVSVSGRVSAGGGCRLLDAFDDVVALNLARPSDRELLPALFGDDALDPCEDAAIAERVACSCARPLVARGRLMGLAIASVRERRPMPALAWRELTPGTPAAPRRRPVPRVLDLSALWAGPLAGRLLALAGAEVVKVESRTRPDAMRQGQPEFYARLNRDKAQVVLDFGEEGGLQALRDLIAQADIVIEAARPRALQQLGVDADALVRQKPGLVWLTLTGHGARGEAANWVGFGDDCGVAGGLSGALLDVSGQVGFVGDAIADPLTGVHAALCGWLAWTAGRGGRYGLALSEVVAHCLDEARQRDVAGLTASLAAWAAAEGQPLPVPLARRSVASDRIVSEPASC